jgi:hypothetical protein
MNMNSSNSLPERERLHKYHAGEKPPGMSTSIVVKSVSDETWLERTLAVMDLIVRNTEDWPDETYWRQTLPDWLLVSFKQYTPEELAGIRADRAKWGNLQWTFGSWLDRIQDRSWRWWSFLRTSNGVTIYLSIDELPFTIKAFVHLIQTAGGSVVQ